MNESDFNKALEKYADITVMTGLNLQKGQRLTIRAELEDAPFVRKVVESAYKAGAVFVDVMYFDEKIDRIRFEQANPETITEIPDWTAKRYEEYRSRGDALLAVYSDDPNLLDGINPDLIAKYHKSAAEKMEPYRKKYQDTYNWCVVSTASPAWSKKVFPDLTMEEARRKLWEAIFNSCRVDTADPVKAWQDHVDRLKKYENYLTTKRYNALHYTAPGTDLTIGLPVNHKWLSGETSTKSGHAFIPNLPTEEVFSMPHKNKVDGVVKASRPLNLFGVLIEGFSVTFENGRAIKVNAQKGEADMRKLIETDENACRLGEVALVPNSSPISQRGHLFYNTLFDENASCHIALGSAYRNTMDGGVDMTEDEFESYGGNKSLIHVDFMIGSAEMDIDGITADNKREPIMRKGEWAFNV